MREFVSMQVSKVAQEFYVCVCHILESARRKCTTSNIVVRAGAGWESFWFDTWHLCWDRAAFRGERVLD